MSWLLLPPLMRYNHTQLTAGHTLLRMLFCLPCFWCVCLNATTTTHPQGDSVQGADLSKRMPWWDMKEVRLYILGFAAALIITPIILGGMLAASLNRVRVREGEGEREKRVREKE